MTEVGRRRNPRSTKTWWESTAIISSATAVLTVALTAYAGYVAQRSLRTNDVATQRAQATYQQEVAVLQAAHLLATESLHYADERSRVTSGEYSSLQEVQRRRVIDSVNASDEKWRKGRQTSKVGLELEFGDDRPILASWDSLSARIDRFANCSVRPPNQGCTALRPPADSALETFRTLVVEHIRRHQPQMSAH
ncbi:MAG: hypothetical protein ABI141_13565 [Gemmatimonadaceae bacterium]